jgi:hypothetical protein
MIVSKSESACSPDVIHHALTQLWTSSFADDRVTYLSGPITTGRRYVEEVSSGTEATAATAFEANCSDLRRTAARLRRDRRETVVEPASLSVPGWAQADYIRLWEHFIERHASVVVFMPDWQYSAGCAVEFAHAKKHGVATETTSGEVLPTATGLTMLRVAIKEITDLGSNRLARLVDELTFAVSRIEALTMESAKTLTVISQSSETR